MKFVLKENFLRDGIEAWVNNFKGISEDLWVCATPCYTKAAEEPKYFCHLLYIARGDKHTAPRKAFYMKDNRILKPVKYEELDEKGHFGGETIGTYTAEGNTYTISIDIDRIKDIC